MGVPPSIAYTQCTRLLARLEQEGLVEAAAEVVREAVDALFFGDVDAAARRSEATAAIALVEVSGRCDGGLLARLRQSLSSVRPPAAARVYDDAAA